METLNFSLIWLAIVLPLIALAIAWQLKWFKYGFVKQNGVWMRSDFVKTLEEAQKTTTYRIDGKDYPRIKYGEEAEDWGADREPCHDCGTLKGQYHTIGCDVERCPVCKGQSIYCECDYDNREK